LTHAGLLGLRHSPSVARYSYPRYHSSVRRMPSSNEKRGA
jgi:hypothetical protein